MEKESLVKLARANINILNFFKDGGDVLVVYEYQWRTPSGHPKWSRGVHRVPVDLECSLQDAVEDIYLRVQELREELEG